MIGILIEADIIHYYRSRLIGSIFQPMEPPVEESWADPQPSKLSRCLFNILFLISKVLLALNVCS